jgi:hypothetical protein
MQHIKCFIFLWFLVGFCITLEAQNTIPATGSNATGSGGSISFTVGQIAFNTLSGSNGTISQGVQQPYEISVVTAVENTETMNLKFLVYPNPTSGLTKLVFESPDFSNLRYQILDISGRLLQDKKVEGQETEISLENLSSSTYFLKVYRNNMEVKVFKIIKK